MRTYDDDAIRAPKAHKSPEKESNALDATLAHRAVADHRPDLHTARSVMHIQRVAGNKAAGAMLEERSPVLDLVGKGGGSPLAPHVQKQVDNAFGSPKPHLRVHEGPVAAQVAESVDSEALTVGNEMVFKNYAPQTDKGMETLLHEVHHTDQQAAGAVDGTPQAGGISVSDPSDRFEQAASAGAKDMMSAGATNSTPAVGAQRSVQRHAEGSAPAPVQREEEDVQTLRIQRATEVQREEGKEEEGEG